MSFGLTLNDLKVLKIIKVANTVVFINNHQLLSSDNHVTNFRGFRPVVKSD